MWGKLRYMRRLRVLGALVALVVLAACNNGALPPGGTYQQLTGQVVDARTNQPIAGAVVTVETVLSQTTDAQGKFTFAQVPVGSVDYTVTAKGYAPYSSTANLPPDKPTALAITLTPKPAP